MSVFMFFREVQVFVYFHPLPKDEGVATTHLDIHQQSPLQVHGWQWWERNRILRIWKSADEITKTCQFAEARCIIAVRTKVWRCDNDAERRTYEQLNEFSLQHLTSQRRISKGMKVWVCVVAGQRQWGHTLQSDVHWLTLKNCQWLCTAMS